MRKYYFSMLLIPFLIGCGNGSSSSTTSSPQATQPSVVSSGVVSVVDMEKNITNIVNNVETTNMALNVKRDLKISGGGYVLNAKVYTPTREAKELGSGKYNFYKTDNNLEIIYIEGGYSDVNNNSKLDTYEPYIPMMYTFSNYYNANPFTTFMVNIFGYYNDNDIVKVFGLSDRFLSFDFDVVEVSKTDSNVAKMALILRLVNIYLSNENSMESGVVTIDNSTKVTATTVNTVSSDVLPNIKRGNGFNSKFLTIYNNLKKSEIVNPVFKLESAVKSTISNKNLFEAIDKVVNANENSTLKELELLIVPNLNIMNYNKYYESIIKDDILNISAGVSTSGVTTMTPSTTINNSNIKNVLPEV